MQGDVRLAAQARIGLAGKGVIMNTMFEMGQDKYDAACPPEFQSTEFLLNHGQLDRVVVPSTDAQDRNLAIQRAVTDVIMKLTGMLRCLCVSVAVCDWVSVSVTVCVSVCVYMSVCDCVWLCVCLAKCACVCDCDCVYQSSKYFCPRCPV